MLTCNLLVGGTGVAYTLSRMQQLFTCVNSSLSSFGTLIDYGLFVGTSMQAKHVRSGSPSSGPSAPRVSVPLHNFALIILTSVS